MNLLRKVIGAELERLWVVVFALLLGVSLAFRYSEQLEAFVRFAGFSGVGECLALLALHAELRRLGKREAENRERIAALEAGDVTQNGRLELLERKAA